MKSFHEFVRILQARYGTGISPRIAAAALYLAAEDGAQAQLLAGEAFEFVGRAFALWHKPGGSWLNTWALVYRHSAGTTSEEPTGRKVNRPGFDWGRVVVASARRKPVEAEGNTLAVFLSPVEAAKVLGQRPQAYFPQTYRR